MTVKHRIEWHADKIFGQVNILMAVVEEESAEMVAKDARRFFKKNYGKYSWSGAGEKTINVVKSKFVDGGYMVVCGGGDEYYMTFLELGADNLAAKPFMRPALNKNKRMIRKKFQDVLE